MQHATLFEIQSFLNKIKLEDFPNYRISVLRNITVEPIEIYLKYLFCQNGYHALIKFGGYNILEDVYQGDVLKEADGIIIFLKLENLSKDIVRRFVWLTEKELNCEVRKIKEYIDSVIGVIRKQTNAVILWHSFEMPAYPAFGILESQSYQGQLSVISALNEFLRSRFRESPNVFLVDTNLCLMRLGYQSFYDVRYWYLGGAPYSREALCEIAKEDCKFFCALKGRVKKCLILDCDDILWGGTIGEDGLHGIILGEAYPGSIYMEFQQEILNLYKKGVILALCSKNNEEDVWEVLDKHLSMLIKREHITIAKINWQNKVDNINSIASDLNVGLDSIVFIDDSEFEINSVREILPQVTAIHFPKDQHVFFREMLVSLDLFNLLTYSSVDGERTAMYKAEAARKEWCSKVGNIEEYLISLNIIMEICFVDELSIPRVAQLTQKTNQFNLTTKRYTDADIRGLAEGKNSSILYLRVKDRFGDSGIVGVCVLKLEGINAIFDSFLISCRVLGRGIEQAFLNYILGYLKRRGYVKATGEYRATRKNEQVKIFYEKNGFQKVGESVNNSPAFFICDIAEKEHTIPVHIKQVISYID
jgi:FkbH-like protein